MLVKYLCAVLVCLAVVNAEVAVKKDCDTVSAATCSVTEVRITPCQTVTQCKVRQGNNSTISFDFIPKFSADVVESNVYWDTGRGDLPFAGFDTDGCKHTSCPVVDGQLQTYTYNLYISKKLPKGPYTIKWTLWNKNDKTQMCCFETNIRIVKK